ncbi:hypothetical protein [Streptomyces alanosinicus]|uniref:Uncharacterized protein n=1 Tax=Streptomyces alanosinicus TaxID=68171 RepID=A0A918YPZ7_9ACTN|nr:hypothetical protein [Streptomyces alanosinicus]GHE10655.1 hypothetical protein GCM10010339_67590 [Streptomyces alanosinicus]
MTALILLPTTANLPAPGKRRARTPGRPKGRQGPSPHEGTRLHELTRGQVEDRRQELGDLYAETSGGSPWAWNQARTAFLRHLAADARRPGFSLLIAETTALTGCAYGFPAGGAGPRWAGLGRHVQDGLLRRAAPRRLFVVSGIVVPPRVCWEHQDRPWNLARRLQQRLLAGQRAALGVTLVDVRDDQAVETLRSWGWRSAGEDTLTAVPPGPFRVLVLAPEG